MAGTTYKSSLFRMTSDPIREKGGVTVGFAGQTVGPVTKKTTLGVPAGQKMTSGIPHGESLATMAAGTNTVATFKPYSAGQYALTRVGEYIMLGESSKIAGVANTLLKTAAGDNARRSVNTKARLDRSYKVTSINYITGALSGSAKTYYWRDMSAAAVHTEVVVSSQQDQAALPNISRAIPGEFTLSETGKTPTAKDYDKKTG